METPDYGARIQRDCADDYSRRAAIAEQQQRREAALANELIAATLAPGGLMTSIHGNETTGVVNGHCAKRPELVWETLRGMVDFRDFDQRMIEVFASACRLNISGAAELLGDMAGMYASLSADDFEGAPA